MSMNMIATLFFSLFAFQQAFAQNPPPIDDETDLICAGGVAVSYFLNTSDAEAKSKTDVCVANFKDVKSSSKTLKGTDLEYNQAASAKGDCVKEVFDTLLKSLTLGFRTDESESLSTHSAILYITQPFTKQSLTLVAESNTMGSKNNIISATGKTMFSSKTQFNNVAKISFSVSCERSSK